MLLQIIDIGQFSRKEIHNNYMYIFILPSIVISLYVHFLYNS